MAWIRHLPGWALVAFAALSSGARATADDVVVARVDGGAIFETDVLSVRARLAPFQLRALGQTWPEQRERILRDLIIPERLLSAASGRGHRRDFGGFAGPRDRALAAALASELQAEAARKGIAEGRVAEYRDRTARFRDRPERVLLWRILLATQAQAEALIAKLGEPSVREWRAQARELSLDEATRMRGGSLGFVSSDGHTQHPQVRVSPRLFAAAQRVPDGRLVPEPVVEGRYYSVVWRRESRPARRVAPRAVAEEIRQILIEQDVLARRRELLSGLVRAHVSELRPELVDDVTPNLERASPVAVRDRLPESRERGPGAARDPLPRQSERGLR